MKTLLILSLLLLSKISFASCVISSDNVEVTEEEQVKGPMKKTTTVVARNAMDAKEIISVTWDNSSDFIEVAFRNKTKLPLSYTRERYDKLLKDWKACQ